MSAKTWMQAIQDFYAFEPVGAFGTPAIGTAGTTIPVPHGARSLLVQTITQNVRFVFAASGSGTAAGFRVTAGNDLIGVPIGETVGTIHMTAETGTASVGYQFLGLT